MVARPDSPAPTAPLLMITEDDLALRELLAFGLAKDGFQVLECGSDHLIERLGILAQRQTTCPLDLVVVDVTGPDAPIDRILAVTDSTRMPPAVLVVAGPDSAREHHADSRITVLRRPVSHGALLRQIRSMVAARHPRSARASCPDSHWAHEE